ncbi:carbohydrate kinase family protein [Patescibacteria group bacterium]
MLDIITIGSALQDIFCEISGGKKIAIQQPLLGLPLDGKIPIEKMHRHLGGGGINSAIVLAKLGLKCAPLIRVGKDSPGEEILKRLQEYQLDVSLVKNSAERPTGISILLHDVAEQEHVSLNHKGASDNLAISEAELPSASWLYVTAQTGDNWREDMLAITELAKDRSLAWNPGSEQIAAAAELDELFARTEVLLVNQAEAKELLRVLGKNPSDDMRDNLEKLHAHGPAQVIITSGANGADLFVGDSNTHIHADIAKFDVVDTTGTGDTFGATYVAGLILDKDPEAALHMAIVNSGAVTREWGAQRGLMKLSEIEKK